MINNITRNSANGKFFYEMQKEELEEVLKVVNKLLKSYDANSASTGASERQRNAELWQAYQNVIFNLKILYKF
jgi:hypothetical protein